VKCGGYFPTNVDFFLNLLHRYTCIDFFRGADFMADVMQVSYDSEKRWELLHVSVKDEGFVVLDNLAKRKRVYHVPQLKHVELIGQAVYVYTNTEKIMRLDLLTATRQFLSAAQFQEAMHSSQTIQLKKRAAKKVQQSFENIANLARPKFLEAAFQDTISA
jgi:hypothetical protein